ncbi:NADH:ubiquinone reductase (Na(+)-transporting) subunit C [Criblamydia sequanensis]|uniref:Na(+)-translocating NADH-quinone reductase subunit C n=1 Tax=Candidatus Criblamydia sequanensis CRIB-18 TaxID=1437425 RepID=A0A090CXR6_9BACT|nr:NADH:ubiquinone reductase (Na(+)-transporting) subunit C [Criblamydia sequanensis]CDR32922.1 putative Na(+)-translocating NADH-quinone reductase subunit C [Criblamydia sequanensis CRIB-18]
MEGSLPTKISSNVGTILFMMVLSLICATILSVIASALAKPKEIARDLDRSKQMMIAAKILDHNGYFLVKDKEDSYIPAKLEKNGYLVPDDQKKIASKDELIEVYTKRLVPLLVDHKGDITTFKNVGLDPDTYIPDYRTVGYYKLPLMLIYKLLPNTEKNIGDPLKEKAEGWVIPVNGFGLWDAIYGYLAIETNGDDVIGITWYDQKETPGLGANIAEAYWQNLFENKKIFQESSSGKTDFKTAPLGITVVKGLVREVYGDSPKAKSAVDGMAGATLTGNGVTDAYKDTLAPYRPFLIKIHEASQKQTKPKDAT